MQRASIPLTMNPSFLNPQEATLNIQAAMKNLQTNSVFYFLIPNTLETLLVPSAPLDFNSFASSWKGLDNSLEVSVILKGKIFRII